SRFRRAAQSWILSSSCPQRRANRAPATDRTRLSGRTSLLVLVEGKVGANRSLRTHRLAARRRAPRHRTRRNFLDTRLTLAHGKMCKVELRVPTQWPAPLDKAP